LVLLTSMGAAELNAQCRRSYSGLDFPPRGVRIDPGDDKSEALALIAATLGAAVPAIAGAALLNNTDPESGPGMIVPAVVLGAVIIGPAAGHFYAGCPQRAWPGIDFRWKAAVAGVGVVTILMISQIGVAFGAEPAVSPEVIHYIVLATGAALATSSIVDVVRSPKSVELRNAERALERLRVSVVLWTNGAGDTGGTGGTGIGLRVPLW
jgi:hypothetical protein